MCKLCIEFENYTHNQKVWMKQKKRHTIAFTDEVSLERLVKGDEIGLGREVHYSFATQRIVSSSVEIKSCVLHAHNLKTN